jgi:hypothetical protein
MNPFIEIEGRKIEDQNFNSSSETLIDSLSNTEQKNKMDEMV